MSAIKRTSGSSTTLSFLSNVSNDRTGIGRFPEAPGAQKIGDNMTLIRHAPDVIQALGGSMTVGELRNQSGLSVSKIAGLHEGERALVLDVLKRAKGTHRPHQRGTPAAHPPPKKKHGVKKTHGHAKKPKVKLPPFGTGQKIGEVDVNGVAYGRMEVSPEIEKLSKGASTAKLLVEASIVSAPQDAIAKVSTHPKSVSVGPNGAAEWAKLKPTARAWIEFMHDVLMAGIKGGPDLSPKFDPTQGGMSVKRVAEKKAALDLIGELVKSKSAPDGTTLVQTKAAANELVRAMLAGKGQRAFEVVWEGPNGAALRAIMAIAAKTGEIRATVLSEPNA